MIRPLCVAPHLHGAATGGIGIGDSFVLLPRILWFVVLVLGVSFARTFLLGRLDIF